MTDAQDTTKANIALWSGVADLYDAYRPQPPSALLDLLTQLAEQARPELVVDIGSGTGLSARAWARRAATVIGIEPNVDMRRQAEQRTAALGNAASVSYRDGVSMQTGLPDDCADIVTISQALHWMEPEPTIAEVARILRPAGVFAAYDYDWPPLVHWEADQAFQALDARVEALNLAYRERVHAWPKHEHLSRIKASGRFRYVREALLHAREEGDAARFIGLSMTNGADRLLRDGLVTEEELDLEGFKHAVDTVFGGQVLPWYIGYRVRLAVR
ncbi:MAG: class I SAM-dependent methyltransferase [Ktedonobacterales bacterium]